MRVLALERPADDVDLGSSLRQRYVKLQLRADERDVTSRRRLRHRRALRHEGRRHVHRHPHIERTDACAVESLRRHPDDRERMTVDRDRTANDARILVEASCPEAIPEHDNGTCLGLTTVGGAEDTSGGRHCAEHGEVVLRHNAAEHALNPGMGADDTQTHRLGEPRVGVHTIEGRGVVTDVAIIQIRTWPEAATIPTAANINQTAGLDHTRSGLEQQRVADREHRRVCADTNGERERGGHREQRVASKQPSRVSQIPLGVVEPPE